MTNVKTQLMFRCNQKTESVQQIYEGGEFSNRKLGGVKLSPLIPHEKDPNHAAMKEFYSYTPGGLIEFVTINEAALEQFEPGKDYLVTIEPAPEI